MSTNFYIKALLPVSYYLPVGDRLTQRGVVEFFYMGRLYSASFIYGVHLQSKEKAFGLTFNPTFRQVIREGVETEYVRNELRSILLESDVGVELFSNLHIAASNYKVHVPQEKGVFEGFTSDFYMEG